MTFENKYISIHAGKPFRFWFGILDVFLVQAGHWFGEDPAYGLKILYYEYGVLDIFDLRIGKFQVNISLAF